MTDRGISIRTGTSTHTCNNYEGVYLDQFYKGPSDYTYYTTEAKAISAWGEMATGSSVDDATSMANWVSATKCSRL